MNILVCISRVPDTASRIIVGSDNKSIDPQGLKYVISPYDEFALEEALRLKEKFGGEVTALTIGSDIAKDILRTALAMKVDKAVLVKTDAELDSFFVAKNIANYAKETSPDLILMGKQSVDYDSLFVPTAAAEMLGIPSVAVVSKLTVDGTKITAERDIEGGKEVVETSTPCIISAQKGLNEPRYPKLPDIMKAKSKPIDEVPAIDADNRTSIVGMEIPSKKRIGKIVSDSEADIDEIVRLLHEEAKVI